MSLLVSSYPSHDDLLKRTIELNLCLRWYILFGGMYACEPGGNMFAIPNTTTH